ncbi:DUF6777 domain-containing protein [Kitasatospora sp. NPDC056138]|uniref:DUF6777 domain-containing protein n=1 Tax=Kitasatospora sp. NPDC056138 TaxID=3345724 RepID=UPI0035E26BE6
MWSRGRTIALVAAVIVVAGAVTFVLTNRTTGGRAAASQVVLQPVSAEGPDPFTGSVATQPTAPSPSPSGYGSSAAAGGSATVTASVGTSAGLSVQGTRTGLYGGSTSADSCDVPKLAGFLASDTAKARAWAGVEGIEPGAIGTYLQTLTPVVLRADTRVTNHGFSNGSATAFQAVLQAGTAVLVDAHGSPRVRCACGNPLLPPALTARPSYLGTPWPSFRTQTVVVVIPAPSPVPQLVVVDPSSGASFAKPVGPTGAGTATGPATGSPPVTGASTPGTGGSTNPTAGASASHGTSGATGPGTGSPGETSPGVTSANTTAPSTTASHTTNPGTTNPGTTNPGTASPGTASPGTTSPETTSPETAGGGSTGPGEASSAEQMPSGLPTSTALPSLPPSPAPPPSTGPSAPQSGSGRTGSRWG